ncbi:S1 family peptidase [Planctomicrobium sp. SH664]|uniref:S1 family peptidase n=1 Tax=Planctomicrobium sp. SH664 TaxID=3448125 RepID=UPI003F5B24DC
MAPAPVMNRSGVSLEQALEALSPVADNSSEEFDVNPELSRGPAAIVFPKAAPSVVVVHTPRGHGTGFIHDKSGWIITNYHVIANSNIDLATGCRMANIYLGKLEEGLMELDPNAYRAIVYYWDVDKDLALLKLVELPSDRDLVPLKLADKGLTPGSDCVAIGHPTRGTLWTVRSGEIAGIAMWPSDSADMLTNRLALTGAEKDNFNRQLASSAKRKVMLSTCGINPGDSGGPLLNDQGELVAVTFGIPKGGTSEGVSFDKFSYHVHLDEVKKFLEKRPASPLLFVPTEWPAAEFSAVLDFDDDGFVDRLQYANLKKAEKPDAPKEYAVAGVLVDLDQNSPADIKEQIAKDTTNREKFDYELVLQFGPINKTFYDTDNDGQLDLILTDINGDDISDLSIRLINGKWTKADLKNQKLIDGGLFADQQLAGRMQVLLFGKPKPQSEASAEPAAETPPPAAAPPSPLLE